MDFFRKPPAKRVIVPMEPAEVPEAEDSDWAAWEDSVAFQDSQVGDFPDTAAQPLMPELDSAIDAFSSVHRKSK